MKYIKVKLKTNMLLSIICAFFLLWTPALFKYWPTYLVDKANIGLNWAKTRKRKTYCGVWTLLKERKTNKKSENRVSFRLMSAMELL